MNAREATRGRSRLWATGFRGSASARGLGEARRGESRATREGAIGAVSGRESRSLLTRDSSRVMARVVITRGSQMPASSVRAPCTTPDRTGEGRFTAPVHAHRSGRGEGAPATVWESRADPIAWTDAPFSGEGPNASEVRCICRRGDRQVG
jgi:hypothetical protein